MPEQEIASQKRLAMTKSSRVGGDDEGVHGRAEGSFTAELREGLGQGIYNLVHIAAALADGGTGGRACEVAYSVLFGRWTGHLHSNLFKFQVTETTVRQQAP